jgi:hypothetical protein
VTPKGIELSLDCGLTVPALEGGDDLGEIAIEVVDGVL